MKRFEEEMTKLVDSTVEMGNLAAQMVERSVNALCKQDVDIAQDVMSKYERISYLDFTIEEESLRILTLYQPMAVDIRTVATVMKTITYLERIGKYSKNIARAAIYLKDKEEVMYMQGLSDMCQIAVRMVQISVRALTSCDLTNYSVLKELEESMDKMRHLMLEENMEYMHDHPDAVDTCTYYISVSRYLERIGDHSCKIAEKVTYMVTGKRITFDPSP